MQFDEAIYHRMLAVALELSSLAKMFDDAPIAKVSALTADLFHHELLTQREALRMRRALAAPAAE